MGMQTGPLGKDVPWAWQHRAARFSPEWGRTQHMAHAKPLSAEMRVVGWGPAAPWCVGQGALGTRGLQRAVGRLPWVRKG